MVSEVVWAREVQRQHDVLLARVKIAVAKAIELEARGNRPGARASEIEQMTAARQVLAPLLGIGEAS